MSGTVSPECAISKVKFISSDLQLIKERKSKATLLGAIYKKKQLK